MTAKFSVCAVSQPNFVCISYLSPLKQHFQSAVYAIISAPPYARAGRVAQSV